MPDVNKVSVAPVLEPCFNSEMISNLSRVVFIQVGVAPVLEPYFNSEVISNLSRVVFIQGPPAVDHSCVCVRVWYVYIAVGISM